MRDTVYLEDLRATDPATAVARPAAGSTGRRRGSAPSTAVVRRRCSCTSGTPLHPPGGRSRARAQSPSPDAPERPASSEAGDFWRCQATEALPRVRAAEDLEPRAVLARVPQRQLRPAALRVPRCSWLRDGGRGPARQAQAAAAGGTGTDTGPAGLDLQPGELVRVRQPDEIAATLDETGHNRRLSFDREMLPYCGKTLRVKYRVDRIIEDKTGRMLKIPRTAWCSRAPSAPVTAARAAGSAPGDRRVLARRLGRARRRPRPAHLDRGPPEQPDGSGEQEQRAECRSAGGGAGVGGQRILDAGQARERRGGDRREPGGGEREGDRLTAVRRGEGEPHRDEGRATSVPDGASAASTRAPAANRPTGCHQERRRTAVRGALRSRSSRRTRRARPRQALPGLVEPPEAVLPAAARGQEIRIGLPLDDRPPSVLLDARTNPSRERHRVTEVQRTGRPNAHHGAGPVEANARP